MTWAYPDHLVLFGDDRRFVDARHTGMTEVFC
jgi:hypothetical protein